MKKQEHKSTNVQEKHTEFGDTKYQKDNPDSDGLSK
jgi:hypothetical protein